MEKAAEDGKVTLGEVIHRPVPGTHPLGGEGEGILVGEKDEGEVVLPEVFIEAILGGEV